MSKHTPGPWKFMFRKKFETFAIFKNDNTPNDAYLATVFPDDMGEEEAEANARLIAAAPDLLEALEKLARLGNGDQYGNSEGNMIARAAIIKATGESPMNDKELLELAAKAAGIEVYWCESNSCYWLADESDSFVPLDNDGDALRLAVTLGMFLEIHQLVTTADIGIGEEEWITCAEKHNLDPYSATRRAIVRAAAEIGKGIK